MFAANWIPMVVEFSTLFEHHTIAVDGRVLKLSVSQQYQPASFGDRVRKGSLLAHSVSEKQARWRLIQWN